MTYKECQDCLYAVRGGNKNLRCGHIKALESLAVVGGWPVEGAPYIHLVGTCPKGKEGSKE